MYDFDKLVDRRGTASVKWDIRDLFGVGPEASTLQTWLRNFSRQVTQQRFANKSNQGDCYFSGDAV